MRKASWRRTCFRDHDIFFYPPRLF